MATDEHLAEILEDCRILLHRGETVERCLQLYPAEAPILAGLLPLVVQARHLAADPPSEFAGAARRRFLERVDQTGAAQRAARSRGLLGLGVLGRVLVPLLLVVVLVGSGLGLVQASADSLPDSPLYTVKQAQERVGRVFAASPAAQVQYELKLSAQRLHELELAEAQGKGPALEELVAVSMVDAFDAAVQQIPQLDARNHATAVGAANQLLPRERRALATLASSPNRQLSATARRLLGHLAADEQHLGVPPP